jgi:hypothetical protein
MFSVKRVAQLLSSARHARWLAPPIGTALGLVLIGLAAAGVVYLLPRWQPIPGNTSAAASAPGAMRPAIPIPPATETVAQSDEPVSTPAASMPQTVKGSDGHKTAKSRASHKWRVVKRPRASFFGRRTAVLSEPCRYHCDDWAEPMTWHGGGY